MKVGDESIALPPQATASCVWKGGVNTFGTWGYPGRAFDSLEQVALASHAAFGQIHECFVQVALVATE